MPVTLRKRLQCHYCGKRLSLTQKQGSRVRCDGCTADNYFDANGEIADVPAEEVNRSRADRNGTDEIASQSDVFCSTCLKNQMIYTAKLSEYLPDFDDPRYDELERALPVYKKRLEEDYPQCCARCEPRVRQRLEQANYTAKSDHLRRMLQRNRLDQHHGLGWRSVIIAGAGVGNMVAILVQLFWHAFSSQVGGEEYLSTPLKCFSEYPTPRPCADATSALMPLSLLAGLLCIWWNPKWQHRLRRHEGRVLGLGLYYSMQAFLLLLRFIAWTVALNAPNSETLRQQIHLSALFIIAICFFWLQFGILSIDRTPLVNWHQEPVPLLEKNQFSGPLPPQDRTLSPPQSQNSEQFPLQNLSGPSADSIQPWRPPTPPTEEDSMDWTPSQPGFQPQPKQIIYRTSEPSPFYGNLPAKPSRGQIINAPEPPPPPKSLGLPPGFFGLSKKANEENNPFESRQPHELALAPPKFFPGEREFVTGLEGIFDRVFSTVTEKDDQVVSSQRATEKEKPHSVFDFPSQPTQTLGSRNRRELSSKISPTSVISIRRILSGAAAVVLSAISVSLVAVDYLHPGVAEAPSDILPYLGVIPALHLIDDCIISSRGGIFSSMWLAFFTLATSFSSNVIPKRGSLMIPMWNGAVVGVVGLMTMQELYFLCRAEAISPAPKRRVDPALNTPATPHSHQWYQQDTVTQSHPSPNLDDTPSAATSYSGGGKTLRSQWPSQSSFIDRRGSNESLNSELSLSSINTSSTATGWKTPKVDHRTFDWQPPDASQLTPSNFTSSMNNKRITRNNPYGSTDMGSLNLGFGIGNMVTGPRNYNGRQTGTPGNTSNRQYR